MEHDALIIGLELRERQRIQRGLILPSGGFVWNTTDDAASTVITIWTSCWRRAYANERAELAEYEQVDLGGEG